MLLFLEFRYIVFTFVLHPYRIHYIVIHFFSSSFCSIQTIYDFSDFSFSKFSEVLSAFTYAKTIDNLRRICVGVNILSLSPFVAFIEKIPLWKALRVNSRPS